MPRPSKKKDSSFPETFQKDVLRERDARLIAALAREKNRPLTYCGMAGVEALDVLKWKSHLDRAEVVERPLTESAERLRFKTSLLSTLTPYLNGNIRIHFEDIWDFVTSASFGGDFPIDIVNLDFCGGLLYEVDMIYPKQRVAFSNMFQVAARLQSSFLLFVTLMPRDRGKENYKSYLNSLFEALVKSTPKPRQAGIRTQADASRRFHERNNLFLFKACLPVLLDDIGHTSNYLVQLVYTRLYTKMVHFAFKCSFVPGILGLPPRDGNDLMRTLNAPIRKLMPNGTEEVMWPPQVVLP